MEELMQKMIARVGLDRATAEEGLASRSDQAHDAAWLSRSNVTGTLPGGPGDDLGGPR